MPKTIRVQFMSNGVDPLDDLDLLADIAGFGTEPELPYKLVAIDLDGTLLRSDKNITKRNADAIKAARAAGVKVVLCSARPPRTVREIYTALGLDALEINYNGALIHDPVRQKHLSHLPLSGDIAIQIVQMARLMDERIDISLEVLDQMFTDRPESAIQTETSKRFKPDKVGPIKSLITGPVTKLMLLAPAVQLRPVRAAIHEQFRNDVGLMESDENLLQYVHPRVDKGRALRYVADYYKIPKEQVLAIGDAPNDISMLKWAGLGCCVSNGWAEALAVADEIIPANDDDAVAYAINTFILKDAKPAEEVPPPIIIDDLDF